MVDDLKKLYDSVSNEYDVGDYESFRNKMKTPDDRKSFYDVVAKNGFDLGDYDTYEKRLSKTFEESNSDEQEGFWNTYFGDLVEKVGAGTADFGGSTYSILDKTYDTVLKPYVQLFTGKSNEDSWLKKQADASYGYADSLRGRSDRYSGENFIDLLKKGDYTGAVGDVFLQASESLPQSIMAMFMGGTGLALTGMSAGTRKYDQLDNMPETKDMPVYSKAINAIVTGATEALTEKLGDVQIGKWLKGLYIKKGKDFVEKTIKNNFGDFIQKQFKRHGLLLAPASEGAEEYIGQIAENITDFCTGATNEWNPMEGTLEAFVYGAGGGAQFASAGVPGVLMNRYKRFDYRRKYNKSKEAVRESFPGEDISNFEEGIMSMPVEEQAEVLDAMDKDPSLSDRQKQVAFDFVQKANDYRSHNTPEIKESERKAREKLIIETQLRQFDGTIAPVTSENGMIQSVNINGSEDAVYIIKGDIVPKVLSDGKTVIDIDKSSTELYYTDEEGKMQVVTPANVTTVLSVDPVDGLRQQFEQSIREQVQLSKEMQAQQATIDNIQNGDEVMYQNESGEVVKGVVEDAGSNPEHVFVDGVAVPREMVSPVQKAEQGVESVPEQPVEYVPDVSVETLPEYPMTKDGKVDYNTLLDQNPELFAEAWEKRSSPEKAKATLRRQVDNITKKIESLNSKLDKETDLNKISDIEDEISILVVKKNRVDDIVKKRYDFEEKTEQSKVPEGLNEAEYYDWVYKESDDIDEVLNAYSQLKETKNPYNNLLEWQRQLVGKKVKADSYYRFGDRNNATPTIKTKWFSKDGISLDVLAKDLSQFGREISEQDIVDFINENPTNTVGNNSEDIDKMGQRFSELASKSAGMKIGKPDSPTGKLFVDLLKAKYASVPNETLRAMEEKLKAYEQVQPPMSSLEGSVPVEMKNNDVPIEDLESYEREMNEKNGDNVLDSNDKSVSLQNNSDQENEIPERVSQGEHRAEASEDSRQEESLDQLRGRIEEASRDARESESGRNEGRRVEEELNRFIESESKKNGVWIPFEDISNLGSPFISGSENDVYLDRENGILYKVNNLMNSGDLLELFNRMDLHNKFFPDTKYDLVGITGFGDGRAVYPIYRQEFIDNAVFATPEEINDYMHSLGFKQTGEAEYSNNEVTISDLRPRNVLKDSDGDIYVIDADFKAKETENSINAEIERQEAEVNTEPTEGQKESGNYKMGHVKINGFDVTIEQPKGSVRSGIDQNGNEWSVTMNNTYGYIRGTKGKDGDHIDVFVGPNPESRNVFVVDQVNPDGTFDEHKVMMGFDSIDEAKAAYLSNYEIDWNGLGSITGVELEDFHEWTDSGTRKLKPFAEYRQVQEASQIIDPEISTSEYKLKNGESIRFTKWKDGNLGSKDDGQFCLIERVFTESGAFSFTSKKKIKSSNDVAYIFRQLETSSIENAFVVMVKKGEPVIIHVGIGVFDQAMVNNAAIKAAYDSIGPDYIAFVHNHPSGRLVASSRDQKALKTIKDMFPGEVSIDGLIIDTTSGEYATFDFSGNETSKMDNVVDNEIPVKLYSFDKVVFDENYDPRNTKKIKSSDDVAAFVSSQRLGKRGKLSYIIIDQSGGIVGNLHSLYTGIEGNESAIANEISSNVIRFGGVAAIPYGDFVLDSSTLKKLNRGISKASGGAVSLLDVVKIDGLHTESAMDNGVMESGENYESGSIDDDIRFRESVPENLEEANNRFNEELQQQIDGKLPKGHVYQLGRPSEALKSAGILDSEIGMSASRLLLKSSKDYKSDHPFDLSEVVNLPNAIQKPIAVFESETDPRRTVVLTELKSKNDNFLVILDVIRDGRRNQVNSVISLYPKSSGVRVGKWFDSRNQNDIGRDLLKWVDKEKALKWLSGHSSNVNATGLSSKRIANIINNFENPTIEQGEISSEVDKMSDDLGVNVKKVRDKKDLPDNVQERMKNGRYPGMFDPKTGEVYIVMNEISDLADAQATMLHEIVGHKGIHGLFGDRLPEFCDQVLASMKESEAKKFIDLANGNKQLAAEEYVASFAEGYTDPTTWEKVKAIVKDFFRKMGIDLKLSDNDLKYILWKGKNRLKEGDPAMATMNKVVQDEVMWRNVQEEKEVDKVREAAEEIDFDNEDKLKFHSLISGTAFKLREGYQDRMLSVKKMQDVIEEKAGVKLPDYMNVYMYENTVSSRNTHETEFFRNNYLRPMTRAISELEESGLSRREIENYVILKHGLERNEYMNEKEGTTNVDYAGVKMVDKELYEGNESVGDFIKRVEGHGVEKLWKAINDANHFSIKKWFDSGMINKATYEKIRGMYKNYVPLRGFDEETASDVYEYFTSAGSPFNSPLRMAKGRRSRADSPFAYIVSMADSSIAGGNKNLMKLHLYRLAQKHPSGLMSVSEPWYEKVKRDGKEVYEMRVPVYSDDINTYRENVEKFNEEMKGLEAKGLAIKGKGRLDTGMKISPFEADEHIVRVRLNGDDKVVYFHGDPRPAQAINGLNDESRKAGKTTLDKLYRSVGKLNRTMAANFTTRNPAFVASNMTRDLIFAVTALNIKEGSTYRNKFMLNIPKASGAIYRYLSGNQDLSNPVDKMFKEFLENGGETGYTALYNIEKFKKMIDREVKKSNMNSAVKGGMKVIDFFSAANRWAEDLSRFSTFMTSREMGRSVLRSTADAKDVTVNFNRKGSGAWGAGFFKGLYLFFNAAVQSLDNFGRMGKAHPIKTSMTVIGYGAMGALLPALLRAMMGDDAEKEYCDLPDYVRKNNVCIYLGKGNGFLTIPLSIELRAFWGIGDAVYQYATGRDDGLSMAGDCLKGLADLLPLNPVGGSGTLWPASVQPVVQAYKNNEDFTGKPIAKENAFNELIPEYRKVYRGTSKWFVKSSEVLNSVTGGDFATRGLIDINPAKVEHLFESYFGGMEKTINQVFKTAFGDTEGKREARNVPIVNRFYNTGGDFAATAKVNERYFNVLNEVKEIDTRLREYNKAIAAGENIDKAMKGIKGLIDSGSMERSKIVSFYAKEVKKIDNMIKSGNLSDDDMENLKEESIKVKRMLLDELQK